MLKRFLLRYRYRRIPKKCQKSRLKRLGYFHQLYALLRRMPARRSDYRTRVKYRGLFQSRNFQELLTYTQRLEPLISAGSKNIDAFQLRYQISQETNLDAFLVDEQHRPYYDDEAHQELVKHLEPIVKALEQIQSRNAPLSDYYESALGYILHDWIEILDALVALELEIHHVQRNPRATQTNR